MNRYRKLGFLASLAMLYTGPSFSQQLSFDSLSILVERNPSLSAYDARINSQNAYAAGARSLDAPKISAGQYQTPYQLRPNMGSFMISAEQPVINPSKLLAKEKYLFGVSRVTAAEKGMLKNELLTQAKQAYFERILLEKKGRVLDQMNALLSYILKDARLRLRYGKEQLSTIYKVSAEIYTLKNTHEELNNQIGQKNIILNTLMNRKPGIVFSVDTLLPIHDYEKNLTDSAALLAARSDLRQLNQSLDLTKLSMEMERSKSRPDFGLQVAHMFSYGGSKDQYILMGSVTLPFLPWVSHEYKANLRGLSYEKQALEEKKRELLSQAIGKIAGIRLALKSKKKQRMNFEQHIIPQLMNSYKTALLAYEQNTGELGPVLESLKLVQNSTLESLDLLNEVIQSEIAYERESEKY